MNLKVPRSLLRSPQMLKSKVRLNTNRLDRLTTTLPVNYSLECKIFWAKYKIQYVIYLAPCILSFFKLLGA